MTLEVVYTSNTQARVKCFIYNEKKVFLWCQKLIRRQHFRSFFSPTLTCLMTSSHIQGVNAKELPTSIQMAEIITVQSIL